MAGAFQRNAFQNNAFQTGTAITDTATVIQLPVNAALSGNQRMIPGKSVIEAEPPRVRYRPVMSSVDMRKSVSG